CVFTLDRLRKGVHNGRRKAPLQGAVFAKLPAHRIDVVSIFMDATNKIDYIEFHATDLSATKAFFEQAFGWKFTDYGPDYTSFADGRIGGGFVRSNRHGETTTGGALIVLYHPRLEEKRQPGIDPCGRIVKDIFSFPGASRL